MIFPNSANGFLSQGKLNDLIILLRNGVIFFYEYSFITAEIFNPISETYDALNIQDSIQAKPHSFEERYFSNDLVVDAVPDAHQRKQLFNALKNNIVEVKATDMVGSNFMTDAKNDLLNETRSAYIVQLFMEFIYKHKNIREIPQIESSNLILPDRRREISWNFNLAKLGELGGTNRHCSNDTGSCRPGLV